MELTYIEHAEDSEQIAGFTAAYGERGVLVTGLRAGEPVFVLRAQDSLALGAMSLWREMAWQLLSDERLAQVDADVAAFIEWRRANQEHMKDPD